MCTIVQYHFQYPQISEKYQLHLLTGGVLFFFNPANKNPKCIRNESEISEMSSYFGNFGKIRNASEIHQKYLKMSVLGQYAQNISNHCILLR